MTKIEIPSDLWEWYASIGRAIRMDGEDLIAGVLRRKAEELGFIAPTDVPPVSSPPKDQQ